MKNNLMAFVLLIAVFLCLGAFPASAFDGSGTAEKPWKIGKTASDTVQAYLTGTDGEKTLHISGSGAMFDFTDGDYLVPWNSEEVKFSIKRIVFEPGSSVTSIGDRAFFDFRNLSAVTIPASVTRIGKFAFESCKRLPSIEIPASVKDIEDAAFEGCDTLTSVTVTGNPSGTSIGVDAFCNCTNLSLLTIGNGVTSIGATAFLNCSSLTSVTIPNSVTSIEGGAFAGAGLTSVRIPNNVTSIAYRTFGNCGDLASVTIPDSVTSIGENAFQGCKSLADLILPPGITEVGTDAFVDIRGPVYAYTGNGLGLNDFNSSNIRLYSLLTITSPEYGSISADEGELGNLNGNYKGYYYYDPVGKSETVSLNVTPRDGKCLKVSVQRSTGQDPADERVECVSSGCSFTMLPYDVTVYGEDTLSVSVPSDLTYDGQDHSNDLIVKDGNTTLEKRKNYNVDFRQGNEVATPKDAGTYTAILAGLGDHISIKGKVDFTIQKADINPKPTVTMSSYLFGGDVPKPTVSGNPGGGAVTYYYKAEEDSNWKEWQTDAITGTTLDGGTYKMYAVVAESDNYKAAKTAEVSFRVLSSDSVIVTIVGHSDTVPYDGKEHSISGYDVKTSNPLYQEAYIGFSGTAEAKRTEPGTTNMGLSKNQFTNTKTADFQNVVFQVTDGYLEIIEKFFTIAFSPNGGTGTMANQVIPLDTERSLVLNTFTREGYGFTGWNTAADGNGTAYSDGQSVKNLAAAGETAMLYAQWNENSEETMDLDMEFVDVRQGDASRWIPPEITNLVLRLEITISGNGGTAKTKAPIELKLSTGGLTVITKPGEVFDRNIKDLAPGKYSVKVKGLPAEVSDRDQIYSEEGPVEGPIKWKYALSARAEINEKDGKMIIRVYLIWDDGSRPEDVIAVYALPEDEIGAYVLRPDGTREYLLFQTYEICMKYLGSDEMCRGPERCFHK